MSGHEPADSGAGRRLDHVGETGTAPVLRLARAISSDHFAF